MAHATPAPDRIIIEDLRVHGIVGVNNSERLSAQDILVNVVLFFDLRETASTDSITNGLNYSTVCRRILTHVESAERFTIEALATDIAGLCVAFPAVHHARVRVSKPHAEPAASSIAVEIERTFAELLCPALIALRSAATSSANLNEAVSKLAPIGKVASASTVYESPDIADASVNCLHAVVRVDTCLPAAEVRRMLKTIEAELGTTSVKAALIDLELCLLGRQVIRARDVSIPNEAILTRLHLAMACSEAWPAGVYPGTQEPLRQIAERLAGTTKLTARPDLSLLSTIRPRTENARQPLG